MSLSHQGLYMITQEIFIHVFKIKKKMIQQILNDNCLV